MKVALEKFLKHLLHERNASPRTRPSRREKLEGGRV
jgi:hypothetical protein